MAMVYSKVLNDHSSVSYGMTLKHMAAIPNLSYVTKDN